MVNKKIFNDNLLPVISFIIITCSQEHTDTSVNSKEIITLISNFRSKIIEVSVNKRAEFASESMLDDSSEESNNWLNKHSEVWSTLSNYADEYCPSWLSG